MIDYLIRPAVDFEEFGPGGILAVLHLQHDRDEILNIGDGKGRVIRSFLSHGEEVEEISMHNRRRL